MSRLGSGQGKREGQEEVGRCWKDRAEDQTFDTGREKTGNT